MTSQLKKARPATWRRVFPDRTSVTHLGVSVAVLHHRKGRERLVGCGWKVRGLRWLTRGRASALPGTTSSCSPIRPSRALVRRGDCLKVQHFSLPRLPNCDCMAGNEVGMPILFRVNTRDCRADDIVFGPDGGDEGELRSSGLFEGDSKCW